MAAIPLSAELRLLRLERRVEHIERTIGINFSPDPTAQPVAPARAPEPAPQVGHSARAATAARASSIPPPLPLAPNVFNDELNSPDRRAGFSLHETEVPHHPPIAPSPQLPYAIPKPPKSRHREPRSPRDFEQTIGLKWAGWIGAIVLVIGAALGVKYAYDNHWFGHMPASMKLGCIVGAGFALIGAGEIVFRRIHKVPAASLFGAGVATLFIGAYVGHQYDLYSAASAQIAMTLATLIGAAVAMRGNLVSIAVLALIGGNVAPLIVGDPNTRVSLFLAYVLMLQVVALALAAWGRGGKWWTLRGLSLATTSLWIAAKLATPASAHDVVLLGAMLMFAGLYHFELITTAWRRCGADPAAKAASPITFSLFVTAALTFGVLWFFNDASRALRGSWVIGIATASSAIGFALPRLKPALQQLGFTYRLAACALVVLAVPIGLGGENILVGWMILSLLFALVAAFTGSRVAPYAAVTTWLLAVVRLGWIVAARYDSYYAARYVEQVWLTAFETPIMSAAVLGWIIALLGHAIVRLIQSSDERRNALTFISILASAIWCAASIIYLPPIGASGMIILGAWLLMTIGHRFDITRTSIVQAAAMLMIAVVKWALIDALAARLSPDWSANQYFPVFNPLMLTGGAIAASLAGMYFLRGDALRRQLNRQDESARSPGVMLALIGAIIAVITIGFSFEIDRIVERAALVQTLRSPLAQLKHLSWTMLWCAAWCSLAFAGMKILDGDRRRRWINVLWIVPTLLVAKYVIVDTVLMHRSSRIAPLLNLQAATAVVLIGSIGLMRALTAGVDRVRGQLALMALFVLAWMGTLEIARAVDWYGFSSSFHVKNLCWTAWWMICVVGAFALGRRFDPDAPANESWHRVLPRLAWVIAVKYLVIDTIAWRVLHRPMPWPLVVNLEAMGAAVVVAGLATLRMLGLPSSAAARESSFRARAAMFAVLTLLWAGTMEIDRAFFQPAIRTGLRDPALAEQVAMSIYWSLFGVATVVFGFVLRTARLRYFGLALLALTLMKVVIVDLRGVDTGYRILSFLGLGMLLLGVSVVYGKVSPKLLGEPRVLST